MSKRSIILRKVGGFYQVFDDDALIISYFFNYKIANYKCGFPVGTIEKVLEKLEENTINYIVKEEQEIIKDYGKDNNYDKFLEKGKAKFDLNKRLERILERLTELDRNRLNELLSIIENEIAE